MDRRIDNDRLRSVVEQLESLGYKYPSKGMFQYVLMNRPPTGVAFHWASDLFQLAYFPDERGFCAADLTPSSSIWEPIEDQSLTLGDIIVLYG